MNKGYATSKYNVPQLSYERRAVQLPSGWWIAVRELNGVVRDRTAKEYRTAVDALAALSRKELGFAE